MRRKVLIGVLVLGLVPFLISLAVAQSKGDKPQAKVPAPIERTGQTKSYEKDDDGALKKGVALPSPRFNDNGDGTVTDNLTGLIWLKDAFTFKPEYWKEAMTDTSNLKSGDRGLNDGSIAGDWRIPNVKELQSLIDYGQVNPPLPSGHPFVAVQRTWYWTSTTFHGDPDHAWIVYMSHGKVDHKDKALGYFMAWPVRGGN